jgi:CheY-like chemotaxis protein
MDQEKKAQKILVIEDDKILGEILSNKLRAEGYETFWELDGEQGLQKMREVIPDLVLLDIVMPKKNGYEVLEDVRKDDSLKGIPIVIISNSGQPIELTRIIELGAKDYIIKAEFSPEEVLEKVRKYLDQGDVVSTTEKENTSNIKILVVEDDSFLHSLIVGRLSKEGYKILTATDGPQALQVVEKEIPDLILLDVIMPGMSGFDVLKTIKADPKYKDISIIMFSNLGQEHEIEEAKNLGADEFLIKAKFTLKEVVDDIKALLKKKGRL